MSKPRTEFRCVVCGKPRREIDLRLDAAGAYRCKDTCWAESEAATPPAPVCCTEPQDHARHVAEAATPPLDVPNASVLAAVIEDTPPHIINSALLDSGEGLATWIVSHWPEYARLAHPEEETRA